MPAGTNYFLIFVIYLFEIHIVILFTNKISHMKKVLFISLLLLLTGIGAFAQVGINADNSVPEPSAMLDVKSVTKGVLVPRMTAAQRDAISSPATGLLVFCTDNNQYYSNKGTPGTPNWIMVNSQWLSAGSDIYFNAGKVGIGTGTPDQKLSIRGAGPDEGPIMQLGNSDLSHGLYLFPGRQNDPNPFILWSGTDPLRFATSLNGFTEWMRIAPDGKVGIGTSVPATILDIASGGNWDLTTGEGDFRIGNSLYRLKMGMALGGAGAGAAGIMQYGLPGGYNVLALGAQGYKILYLNGNTQRVGIGTDAPVAALDVHGTFALADGTQGAGKVLTSDAGGTATWANAGIHTIGESYGGGIVFYVYDNGRHGLIAATADQSTGVQWYNGSQIATGTTGDGINAGVMNTALIVAAQIAQNWTTNFAAKICADYSATMDGVSYGDWYLPSKYEVNLLYLQKALIGGFSIGYYWSSSENNEFTAWSQAFSNGFQTAFTKYATLYVRAVRAF